MGSLLIPADEIFVELHKINNSVSLSTVYRTQETLVDNTLLNKIDVENDNHILYEPPQKSASSFLGQSRFR